MEAQGFLMNQANGAIITIDAPTLANQGFKRIWLLTAGNGSFAMGTAAGYNTSRYHGLLVAAQRPPVGRAVTVSQTIDRLVLHEAGQSRTITLGGALFRNEQGDGIVSPAPDARLERVEVGATVTWHYRFGKVAIKKTLTVHPDKHASTLTWHVTGLDTASRWAQLRIQPMLALRDFHHLRQREDGDLSTTHEGGTVTVSASDDLAVTLDAPGGSFDPEPDWWHGFFLPSDSERGQDDREDAFTPGHVVLPIHDGKPVTMTMSPGRTPTPAMTTPMPRTERLAPVARTLGRQLATLDLPEQLSDALALASDDFVVKRTVRGNELSTILAGYPWFADWGRDTFIALPGLLLCTGRFDEARDVLVAFASAIRNGLVPNRFDDYDDSAAHYNTVDASLWFIHAATQYVHQSGDLSTWQQTLADACWQIITHYRDGTDGPIGMDDDGLIVAGSYDTQLTWMDAKAGDVVFTPRYGKAVEINALWYHALCRLAQRLPEAMAEQARSCNDLAKLVRRNFAPLFLRPDGKGLFDHVRIDDAGNTHIDEACRPNQVFAASLEHCPLTKGQRKAVVKTVREQLLTPVGLRTLPPTDPAYHGQYTGNGFDRDEAYHQGTIWPWLLGPFVEATLRAGDFSKSACATALRDTRPLVDHMLDQGAGQISEIFEANADEHGNHRPVGCPAQAWSVSELLRVLRLISDHI